MGEEDIYLDSENKATYGNDTWDFTHDEGEEVKLDKKYDHKQNRWAIANFSIALVKLQTMDRKEILEDKKRILEILNAAGQRVQDGVLALSYTKLTKEFEESRNIQIMLRVVIARALGSNIELNKIYQNFKKVKIRIERFLLHLKKISEEFEGRNLVKLKEKAA